MWPLRRAINPLRKQGSLMGASRYVSAGLKVETCSLEKSDAVSIGPIWILSNTSETSSRFFGTMLKSQKLFMGTHSFSSQAGAKSSGEEDDDLEDGFSELETSVASDAVQGNRSVDTNVDELISEPELSEEDVDDGDVEGSQAELDVLDAESDVAKKAGRKRVSSELFKAIMASQALSVSKIMEKWIEEGKEVTRSEISVAMLNLRKRRMFGRALQLSEWLESNNHEFLERDYASRLDLIAKVRGLQKAESYIQQIPESFRSELVYRTLLANCVSVCNVKKSEEVFNKIKDLEFPITSFVYNQLLLLYKRIDRKKIADVLLLMEKDNVKPSLFTYRILLDIKGQSSDIIGMERIVETMKADGIEPDFGTKCILIRHYASAGLKEKAEAVLEDMGGIVGKGNRWACQSLLPLYAALGNADEVGRIWQVCESNPRLTECVAAIEAWGKLNKIEEAEAVFETMLKKFDKLPAKYYSVLLKIYTDHRMLAKGKDLVKRMADSGCKVGPVTWDALVKLYVEAGEVEKADSILHKAAEQNRVRPMMSSYLAIMEQYAKRGDVHNTEKLFHRMRQVGYVGRIRPFQSLIQAYSNAKTPAYGILERMKADNLFPNKATASQLAQIDAFKRTAVADLLD
ncbi:hypothetical protein M9H77_23102 [Catharanthus roseus]|uniref:Uncharacterized protein n=1 Tax=Catharanthus roseus TaxID=4058 RepID=A0ACC0AUI4_CATRO|nr:hypothetical protein M9H77_23102 [Catharanthus roseus]